MPLDFDALLARVHPAASRVERLSRETPARFVAFDVISLDGEDLRERPFRERRALLSNVVGEPRPAVRVTPATQDRARALEWLAGAGNGIDGVMAKPTELLYRPGARAMLKVKPDRTADCVVAGFRPYVDRPFLSSLLLGLYDDDGALRFQPGRMLPPAWTSDAAVASRDRRRPYAVPWGMRRSRNAVADPHFDNFACASAR
jgi:ATP-dependent DNA ligase